MVDVLQSWNAKMMKENEEEIETEWSSQEQKDREVQATN